MNLGAPEILVLLVAALLIFGPSKLPEIARSLGKAIRGFQQEASRAAGELRSATEDIGVVDRPDVPADVPAADPKHEDT